jgi:hypothetical protein
MSIHITKEFAGLLMIIGSVLSILLVTAHAVGWRFKKVTWNWTSLCVGVHAGRNPATGARFAYVGLGYGLGLDFHRPEEGRK